MTAFSHSLRLGPGVWDHDGDGGLPIEAHDREERKVIRPNHEHVAALSQGLARGLPKQRLLFSGHSGLPLWRARRPPARPTATASTIFVSFVSSGSSMVRLA